VILDDFQCYKSRTTRNTPKFTPIPGIKLIDRFTLMGSPPGYLTVDTRKMNNLCAPADVNGQDPSAPTHPDHETGYQMRVAKNTAPFARVLNQKVLNTEFGMLQLDVLKPAQLLMATSKDLIAPPPLLATSDNFSCYKVRTSRGTPKFVPVTGVTIQDQFGLRTMTVKKPTLLCTAANLNDTQPGVESHAGLLLCYKLQRPGDTPRFTTVSPVYINNDFGPLTIDVKKNDQLCVLSLIVP
jgi:hypothetical protein